MERFLINHTFYRLDKFWIEMVALQCGCMLRRRAWSWYSCTFLGQYWLGMCTSREKYGFTYLLTLAFAGLAYVFVYVLLQYDINLIGHSMRCFVLPRQTRHEHIKSQHMVVSLKLSVVSLGLYKDTYFSFCGCLDYYQCPFPMWFHKFSSFCPNAMQYH